MNSAQILLQKHWNHQTFREPQEKIINAVLKKKNVIALLPTGAGKSVCFQLPALINDGVCIVISPLIALMEDQVRSLQEKGIKAIALNSKLNVEETINAFDNLQYGNYKFLYLSPEKLQSEFIQEKISQLRVDLIAIDEVHCISQWGHDFRPAYLKIAVLKKIHPNANFIALTASATPKVLEDIIQNLELDDVTIFKKSFYRDNLEIKLIHTENVFERLIQILLKINEPVIVYTGTRKSCIHISNYLNNKGLNSTFYHGGLAMEDKTKSLISWTNQKTPIMVATNAFGMGIDKANVRAIIHMNIPNSIENYMQEIGRAGRDGKRSQAYLIYNDNTLYESDQYLKKGISDVKFCKDIYRKLNEHYQITTGEIQNKTYALNLQEFCSKYDLPVLKSFSALNNFEHENIIALHQNVYKRSRLKIIVSNNYLFAYEKRNPKIETILKVVLRNYGGTFEQLTTINESFIAKKLNISKPEVITLLQILHKDKIIVYIKAINNAEIRFLVPREDNFVMNNISKNIELRNRNKINKAKALASYITNDKICRNIQLLSYFGEMNTVNCNLCDVCLKKQTKSSKVDYHRIAKEIILMFTDNDQLNSNEIIDRLPFDKENILKTLQLLIEKNTLVLNLQNKFEKIKNE